MRTTRRGCSGNFAAGIFDTGKEIIKFCGEITISQNTRCKLIGEWIEHAKYGKQFRAITYEPDIITDPSGLARYIAGNKKIVGIGPEKAKKMVQIFGSNLEKFLNEPDKRETIANQLHVPIESIETLQEEWTRDKHLISSKAWLAGMGLTPYQITCLIERYGPATQQKLLENPYLLIQEIDGWGFKRVDDVALSMGLSKENDQRIKAGIIYAIKQEIQNGHTWIGFYKLLEEANKILYLDSMDSIQTIENAVLEMANQGEIYYQKHGYKNCIISLHDIYITEYFIWDYLKNADNENPHRSDLSLQKCWIDCRDLNYLQNKFWHLALNNSITCLCGGAGTGKTFTLGKICELYRQAEKVVACCALAGKAARRLEISTRFPASTIHRLLEFDPKSGTFLRNKENPIDADAVIIDEFSMVDIYLAASLFDAIDLKKTAIIIVGDHNQLPSIGPGAILQDITNSNLVPKIILEETMRQSGELKINSNLILQGTVIRKRSRAASDPTQKPVPWLTLDNKISSEEVGRNVEMIAQQVIDSWGEKAFYGLQFITPMKKGDIGTENLNKILQKTYQTLLFKNDNFTIGEGVSPRYFPNDKIIQTRNNASRELFNGTLGKIKSISESGAMTIEWDDGRVMDFNIEDDPGYQKDIQLAYALTIHKTQGSEFPIVVVICYKSHAHMLHRNLLYTAVTRARESCVIVGDMAGIKIAVEKTGQNKRNTFLPLLIENT